MRGSAAIFIFIYFKQKVLSSRWEKFSGRKSSVAAGTPTAGTARCYKNTALQPDVSCY